MAEQRRCQWLVGKRPCCQWSVMVLIDLYTCPSVTDSSTSCRAEPLTAHVHPCTGHKSSTVRKYFTKKPPLRLLETTVYQQTAVSCHVTPLMLYFDSINPFISEIRNCITAMQRCRPQCWRFPNPYYLKLLTCAVEMTELLSRQVIKAFALSIADVDLSYTVQSSNNIIRRPRRPD